MVAVSPGNRQGSDTSIQPEYSSQDILQLDLVAISPGNRQGPDFVGSHKVIVSISSCVDFLDHLYDKIYESHMKSCYWWLDITASQVHPGSDGQAKVHESIENFGKTTAKLHKSLWI